MPFIVNWPGKVEAGSTSDYPSSFPDMMPTFAEIAGIDLDRPTDGHSLLPAFAGLQPEREKDLYWEHGDQQALRHGDWKLVRRRLGKNNPETKLFDLATDPGEKKDLSKEQPEILQMMIERAAATRFPSLVFPNPGLDAAAGS